MTEPYSKELRSRRDGTHVVLGAWMTFEFYLLFGWIGGVAIAAAATLLWIAQSIYVAGLLDGGGER